MPSLCPDTLRFRVATINLMAPAGPFLPWGDRAKNLAALLADEQPDLIGTQEATPEAIADFQQHLPDYGVLVQRPVSSSLPMVVRRLSR